MADGTIRTGKLAEQVESTVGYEKDLCRQDWDRSKLPGSIRLRLEAIDRRVNAANVLADMLGAHIRGRDDEADNEGVRYNWLNQRQAWAIADATNSLLQTVCEDMEQIREDSSRENGNG